jgi:hypothetical protein
VVPPSGQANAGRAEYSAYRVIRFQKQAPPVLVTLVNAFWTLAYRLFILELVKVPILILAQHRVLRNSRFDLSQGVCNTAIHFGFNVTRAAGAPTDCRRT